MHAPVNCVFENSTRLLDFECSSGQKTGNSPLEPSSRLLPSKEVPSGPREAADRGPSSARSRPSGTLVDSHSNDSFALKPVVRPTKVIRPLGVSAVRQAGKKKAARAIFDLACSAFFYGLSSAADWDLRRKVLPKNNVRHLLAIFGSQASMPKRRRTAFRDFPFGHLPRASAIQARA